MLKWQIANIVMLSVAKTSDYLSGMRFISLRLLRFFINDTDKTFSVIP